MVIDEVVNDAAVNDDVGADELIKHAIRAQARAYAPYSNYHVGAAVLTRAGGIIVGCNVENAAYGSTICAERVALTSAIAQAENDFIAIAIVTSNGGSPCGSCRQVMAELGPQMNVYICDESGNYRTTTVKKLLPDYFNDEKLT